MHVRKEKKALVVVMLMAVVTWCPKCTKLQRAAAGLTISLEAGAPLTVSSAVERPGGVPAGQVPEVAARAPELAVDPCP